MEIKFHGKYDRKLFYKSILIANQPARRKVWVLPLIGTIVFVTFIILVIRLIITGNILDNASYIVIVMIAASFVIRSYLVPYLAARKLWINPAIHEEHSGSVTQTEIVYLLKMGKNEIPWERFSRVRKSNGVITLVTRDGLMVIFPRRFFNSDTDWRKFNQLVDTKILAIK